MGCLAASCASQENAQKPEGPIRYDCEAARRAMWKALRRGMDNTEETSAERILRRAQGIQNVPEVVYAMRKACGMKDDNAVFSSLIEEMPEDRQWDHRLCDLMLKNSERIPRVCGVLNAAEVVEHCGVMGKPFNKWMQVFPEGSNEGREYRNMAGKSFRRKPLGGRQRYTTDEMLMSEAGERLELHCRRVGDPPQLHLSMELYRREVRDGIVSFIERIELSEDGFSNQHCVTQIDEVVCKPIECPPEETGKFFRRNRLCE